MNGTMKTISECFCSRTGLTVTADVFIRKYDIKSGVKISIKKRIPVAAGLAGGSSDAAAVLRAMMKLFDIYPSGDELTELALSLGADVPYCLEGGTCIAEQLGEQLTKIQSFSDVHILLVKPNLGIATAWCFKNYKPENVIQKPDLGKMVEAIEKDDVQSVCDNLSNVLESVIFPEYPVVCEIKKKMLESGAVGAVMSGSGPSVYGIFADEEQCEKAMKEFDNRNMFVCKTKTI